MAPAKGFSRTIFTHRMSDKAAPVSFKVFTDFRGDNYLVPLAIVRTPGERR